MRRSSLIGLLLALSATAGCDSDSFAPPPPTTSRPSAVSGGIPARAKEIALILPRQETDEFAFYENAARLETGALRAVFRVLRPGPNEPASRQGELIRKAVAEGASAIVVVADDPVAVAEAIGSIDPKKVPIVLLGRPVPEARGATLVTFPNFAASAKGIVAALNEDVKKSGFPDDAPAILMKVEPRDETSAARDVALIEAMATTKHKIVTSILVTDPPDQAKPKLEAALREHPDVCAILADSDSGISVATEVRGGLKSRGKFLIGSYLLARNNLHIVTTGQVTAVAERNLDGLVRKAVQVALERVEGKTVPDKIEVEVPLRRASKAFQPSRSDAALAASPLQPREGTSATEAPKEGTAP